MEEPGIKKLYHESSVKTYQHALDAFIKDAEKAPLGQSVDESLTAFEPASKKAMIRKLT